MGITVVSVKARDLYDFFECRYFELSVSGISEALYVESINAKAKVFIVWVERRTIHLNDNESHKTRFRTKI